MVFVILLVGVSSCACCRQQHRPSVLPTTCTVLPTACATESASVAYLGRSREWHEHRIRQSLQQSCHLDHAATDQHSLSHASARAYKPLTAPNRVPSVRSKQPTSAPRHPPKTAAPAPRARSAQLGSDYDSESRPRYHFVDRSSPLSRAVRSARARSLFFLQAPVHASLGPSVGD